MNASQALRNSYVRQSKLGDPSIQFSFKDNWSVSMLRCRLRAYLKAQTFAHERHKQRIDTWHRKETGQEHHDRTPTWMTVGLEISNCEACWPYLYSDEEPLSDQTDAPLEEDEPAGEDYGATIRAEALRQFTEGAPARTKTGIRYRKYTKPEVHKLNAIAVFLLEKGFLAADDLSPPPLRALPEKQERALAAFAANNEKLLPDRFFVGDFESERTAPGLHQMMRLSLHLNDSAIEYTVDSHAVLFRRHRGEKASLFQQRIEIGRPEKTARLAGRARFEESKALVMVLAQDRGPRIEGKTLTSRTYFLDETHRAFEFALQEELTGEPADLSAKVITEPQAWEHAKETLASNAEADIFTATENKKLLSIQGSDRLMPSDEEEKDVSPAKLAGRFLFKRPGALSDRPSPQTELELMADKDSKELQLLNAVFDADVDCVQDLIDEGADVNFSHPDDGLRPIQAAASIGAFYVIEALLKRSELDVLVKDHLNRLPSHLAMFVADDPDLCDTLLSAEMRQAAERGLDYKQVLKASPDSLPDLEP
jgi:hypothetical protein